MSCFFDTTIWMVLYKIGTKQKHIPLLILPLQNSISAILIPKPKHTRQITNPTNSATTKLESQNLIISEIQKIWKQKVTLFGIHMIFSKTEMLIWGQDCLLFQAQAMTKPWLTTSRTCAINYQNLVCWILYSTITSTVWARAGPHEPPWVMNLHECEWLSWLIPVWASLEPKLWAGPQEPLWVMNLNECDSTVMTDPCLNFIWTKTKQNGYHDFLCHAWCNVNRQHVADSIFLIPDWLIDWLIDWLTRSFIED